MIPAQGGKSNSSRDVAPVVRTTNTAALIVKGGRYDFGWEGYLWMRGIGKEYISHKILWVSPRIRLKAIL
jgi:hypothetical protein